MNQFKIRKARKEDLEEYLRLMIISTKEYSHIINRKVSINEKQLKKEARKDLLSKENVILLISNKKIIGYFVGTLKKHMNQIVAKIEYMFILKEFRRKNLGSLLIREFIKLLKKKKIKKLNCQVSIKNKISFDLLKKFGFDITDYHMEKKLK